MERKLYRSRTDRMIAGVCGGLAAFWGLDPSLVRLLAVLVLVVGNVATLVAYIVMVFVVEEEPLSSTPGREGPAMAETPNPPTAQGGDYAPPLPPPPAPPTLGAAPGPELPSPAPLPAPVEGERRRRGGVTAGIALIVIGAVLLAGQMVPGFGWWSFWPLIIVIAGLVQAFTPGRTGWSVNRLFDGLVTMAFGLILLGNTTGYLSWSVWLRILMLWPVLLISIGFSILGKGIGQNWLRVIGSVAVLAALAYAAGMSVGGGVPVTGWIWQPATAASAPFEYSAPILNAKDATLQLRGGVGRISVESGTRLITAEGQASFGSPTFDVTRSGDTANVEFALEGNQGIVLYPGTGAEANLALASDVLWEIDVETGVSEFDADLSNLRVGELKLSTGVSDARVTLGDVPSGVSTARVTIKSGVSTVGVRVPRGAEVRVESKSGLAGVSVDGAIERQPDSGDGRVYETAGYASASERYLIRIEAGIGSVSVDQY